MPISDRLLADLKLLHPKLIDLSLGRIELLLAKLDNPHHQVPSVVHVAGTNGKGSVTAYLGAMLAAGGYAAHAYTSPHLVRFHERIGLGRPGMVPAPIGEDALVDVLTRVQAVNDGDDITQFEITTAAAFLAFSEQPADVLLLEVGLGGRLDATNVIDAPALTVITPVSIDHADKLGSTLEAIAAEKAGILKPGVIAVVSAQDPAALAVIERRADEIGAPLFVWGEHFEAFEQRGRLIVQSENRLLDLPLPALVGPHQIVNAGTAVAAALKLEFARVDERAIEHGLVNVRWPARMQRLDGGPINAVLKPGSEVWLDGGHNPAAGRVLAQTLADLEERSPKPVYLIVGMLGLKDAAGFLAHFAGLSKGVFSVPIPGSHEAPFSPEELALIAKSVGLDSEVAESVDAALRRADQIEPGRKRVLICGSLYLAGHVLALQEGVVPQAN